MLHLRLCVTVLAFSSLAWAEHSGEIPPPSKNRLTDVGVDGPAAPLRPEEKTQMETWIHELADNEPTIREGAQKKLIALAAEHPDLVDTLLQRFAVEKDPERRYRLANVLNSFPSSPPQRFLFKKKDGSWAELPSSAFQFGSLAKVGTALRPLRIQNPAIQELVVDANGNYLVERARVDLPTLGEYSQQLEKDRKFIDGSTRSLLDSLGGIIRKVEEVDRKDRGSGESDRVGEKTLDSVQDGPLSPQGQYIP